MTPPLSANMDHGIGEREALLALAKRCEAATGPDRSLDKEIHGYIDPRHVIAMDLRFVEMKMECEKNGLWPQREAACRDHANSSPHYTRSIDAAMKLVPEGSGRWPQLEYMGPNPNDVKVGHRFWIWLSGTSRIGGKHLNSMPLAICAAALRARALPAA